MVYLESQVNPGGTFNPSVYRFFSNDNQPMESTYQGNRLSSTCVPTPWGNPWALCPLTLTNKQGQSITIPNITSYYLSNANIFWYSDTMAQIEIPVVNLAANTPLYYELIVDFKTMRVAKLMGPVIDLYAAKQLVVAQKSGGDSYNLVMAGIFDFTQGTLFSDQDYLSIFPKNPWLSSPAFYASHIFKPLPPGAIGTFDLKALIDSSQPHS